MIAGEPWGRKMLIIMIILIILLLGLNLALWTGVLIAKLYQLAIN